MGRGEVEGDRVEFYTLYIFFFFAFGEFYISISDHQS